MSGERGRVLVTGFTTQHAGGKVLLKYDPVSKLFAAALRHAGYEVDQTRPLPGMDLTGYDLVFFGLAPLSSLASAHAYPALDTLARAKRSGCAVMFFVDDWQINLLDSSVKTILREPKRLGRESLRIARAYTDWMQVTENRDSVMPVVQALAEGPWPATVMPLYDGGDWDMFRKAVPTKNLVGVDPTPFYTEYPLEVPPDSQRERAWTFGIVSDQRKWLGKLGNGWEVKHAGGKASKAPERLYEADLVQSYTQGWGVLSCPYWSSGSGWFRARHEHAMRARCVIHSEKGELSFIDGVFDTSVTEVESLSPTQLRELADAQWRAWYRRRPSRDEVAERLAAAVDEEIGKVKS